MSTVPAQATVPDITGISAAPTTIYPLVANAKRPGFTTITVTGNDPSTIDHLEVRNAATTNVRTLNLNGGSSVPWDGRNGVGQVVAAGTYTVVAIGAGSDVSPFTAAITVSTKKLIHKTFKRTVTAAGSMFDKSVGKCSTLRKPSKRGWAGSLGFYANTKCQKQTWKASAVITAHSVRLPVAEAYTDVRVSVYGGAAKARKSSRGQITYVTGTKPFTSVNPVMVSKALGNHFGALRKKASEMVDSQRYFVWDFATAYKDKYDVKNFTVVVHYDVLG